MAWYINEDGGVYEYADPNGVVVPQAEAFPNDFHTPYATQEEAERAADLLDVAAGGGPVEQMSYEEATSYAIFAINTLIEPDASSDRDVERLFEYADQVIATLADMRDAVRGAVVPEDPERTPPRWPAVTPT